MATYVSTPRRSMANSLKSVGAFPPAEKTMDFDGWAKQNDLQYGRSYMTFDKSVDFFNVSMLPDYDNLVMPYVGHVIFTRPSLYVNVNDLASSYTGSSPGEDPNAGANFNALRANAKTAAFVNDSRGKKLLHMLSEFSTNPYMPIFTSRAANYSVGDVNPISVVEKGQTYYNHSIPYASASTEYRHGNTLTIDFRNDRNWTILWAVYLWMSYAYIVSFDDSVKPSWVSQMNGVLDYAASVYYIVTAMDMREIVYWEKLVGVFPTTAPFSIFSWSDAPVAEEKVSIEFRYGMRSEPMDPSVLFDLNVLSGTTFENAVGLTRKGADYFGGGNVRPDNYSPNPSGDALALRPVVRSVTDSADGVTRHYLEWIDRLSRPSVQRTGNGYTGRSGSF